MRVVVVVCDVVLGTGRLREEMRRRGAQIILVSMIASVHCGLNIT